MVIRNNVGGRLAVGGALAALAVGGLTMSERALGVAPAAPPACPAPGATTLNDIPGSPVAIPDGTGTALSRTITVAGAPAVLTDVDVSTFIAHTWSGELDLTITSPQGTTVILKRPRLFNGGPTFIPGATGDEDNSFNGTTWDDDAAAEAMGILYNTNTPKPALVPEGALGAFVGQNPNGVWTLRVQDTNAGDPGTLGRWGLTINGIGAAPPTTATSTANNTPVGISATGTPTVTSDITVSGANPYLWDVNAITNISHAVPGDLTVTLRSPAGTVRTLTSGNGTDNGGAFAGTTWDDGGLGIASPPVTTVDFDTSIPARMQPEGAMGAFIGENPNGVWRLTIADGLAGDGGTLNSWSLNIASTAGCAGAPAPGPGTPGPGPTPVTLPPGPSGKVAPKAVGFSVKSARDRKAPFAFAFSGRLNPPAGITTPAACKGKVRVQLKAGKKLVSQKSVNVKLLKGTCRWSAAFSFGKKPAALPNSGNLKATARYLGSGTLKAKNAAKALTIKLG